MSSSAPYVTTALDSSLSAERVLTGTANQIAVTDNGAGSTIVLSTPQDLHSGATPTFADLILSGGLKVGGTVRAFPDSNGFGVPNAHVFAGKDSGGTVRALLGMGALNYTDVYAGASGLRFLSQGGANEWSRIYPLGDWLHGNQVPTLAIGPPWSVQVHNYNAAPAMMAFVQGRSDLPVTQRYHRDAPIYVERWSASTLTDPNKHSPIAGEYVSDLVHLEHVAVNSSEDGGSLSSATTTTLTDSTKSWTNNQWVGHYVQTSHGERKITSNSPTVLTVTAPWTAAPTGRYSISAAPGKLLAPAGLTVRLQGLGSAINVAASDTGTITASGETGAQTLTDSTKAWDTNQWAGYYLDTNLGSAAIISNTGTELTYVTSFGGAPSGQYTIRPADIGLLGAGVVCASNAAVGGNGNRHYNVYAMNPVAVVHAGGELQSSQNCVGIETDVANFHTDASTLTPVPGPHNFSAYWAQQAGTKIASAAYYATTATAAWRWGLLLEGPTHGYTEAAIYVNNPHASGKLISLLQGGTELFMVTAGGKVGIGSTPASEYLVTIKQNGTQLYLRCSDADTGWIFDVPNSNDALQIYQRTAGSNTFRYHIDANGAHYMDAGADQVLGLNAASAPFLAWYRGGNRKAYMQSSTTSLAIVQEENLPLFFYTNSALRMFISAGGNVGIGDAQDASFCLTVKHSPNAVLARFWATHATYGSHVHQLLATRAANSSYSFLTCYSDASGSIDLEFQLLGDGNAYCDGAWNGGGADYAEYFESADGSPIPPGTTVVLVGDKVRPALASDAREDVIGVVRPRGASAAAGNAAHTRWTGKYLRGAFGGYDLDQDGKRRPSPAYDASREYVAARAAAGVDRSGASRAGADPGRPADASRLAAYESTFSG